MNIPNLHMQAQMYCDTLVPGDQVLLVTDGPTIEPFRHLLKAVLWRRGLILQEIPGGWIVRAVPTMVLPAPGPVRVECRICGGSWFSGECEHGIGNVVVVR